MKTVILSLTVLFLAGCGSGASSTPASFNAKLPDMPVTGPSASPSPSPIQLTYYKLSRTVNLTINTHLVGPITTNAMSVVYGGTTYVWDDGPQGYADAVANGVHYGPMYMSYFDIGLMSQSGQLVTAACGFQCQQDVFTQPTTDDSTATMWFGQFNSTSGVNNVNQISSSGAAIQVNCTLSGSTLNCVDFSINLGQTPM